VSRTIVLDTVPLCLSTPTRLCRCCGKRQIRWGLAGVAGGAGPEPSKSLPCWDCLDAQRKQPANQQAVAA